MLTTKQTKKITSIEIGKLLQNPTQFCKNSLIPKNRTLPQFDKRNL